jgi:hypothetical protein
MNYSEPMKLVSALPAMMKGEMRNVRGSFKSDLVSWLKLRTGVQ